METTAGELVLQRAVAAAEQAWGTRLLAGYALGSLAHGGFSELVSDVDLGLILADPLEDADGQRVGMVEAEVREAGLRLGDRLSIFWGSMDSLSGAIRGGRFPAYDRLDLIRHGRLLHGGEVRGRLPEPSLQELTVESATFALKVMSVPAKVTDGSLDATALLLAPERMLGEEGVRVLTKLVLFPVRFLYVAHTGRAGTTQEAAVHFLEHHEGPAAELVTTALKWRSAPTVSDRERAELLPLLRAELRPLYLLFIDEHVQRTREYGYPEVASGLLAWRSRLEGA